MGFDLKTALAKVLGGLNTNIYQPVADKVGAFRNYIVLVLTRTKPTTGLRPGGDTEGAAPVSLGNRAVSSVDGLEIPKAYKLTEEQKQKLDQWVKMAPDESLQDFRRKAVDRIIEASSTRSSELSFADLRLTDLPDVLAEIPFITKLDLSKCLFTRMPSCIKEMPVLQELNLSGVIGINTWGMPKENFKSLRHLTLDSCWLSEVPAIVNLCPNLTNLSLQNNKIKNIPEIPPQLSVLNLDHNNIDSLPQTLSKKRKHLCVVMLDFNPINPITLNRQVGSMSKRVQLWGARQEKITDGPRIILSYTGRNEETEIRSWSNIDLLEHWFKIDGRPVPEELMEHFKNNATIRLFLQKMTSAKDYLSRDRFEHLAARVCNLLEAMNNDKEIYEACYDAIEDATASCADRASRGLSEAEFALKTVKAKRDGMKALIELGEAYYRKNLVDDQALKRFGTLTKRTRDDVETVLFFEIYFARKFDLPIDSDQQMRYVNFAFTSQEDLDKAEAEIQSILSNRTEDDRCSFLAEWKPWREYLEATPEFEDALQKINGEFSEKIDALNIDPTMSDPDNIPSDEELQEYYSLMEQREKATEKLYKEETKKILA
ncbi:hypothetical protein M3P05_03815 [Sansalvadorimonas sp. 2012CJ34-2]|uniref:RING-type E3 ubiquitin transferase n=1 Tax=Parendozoicomonas callyspongiae TaxID=2942213 RepID=A0ABT0PEV3_9GAMM|nr:NEL-type E3 ubiquitin ligase domain-containing protein [Sansalvadorimonas sp. 2012CJ34-2]MCL6269068.1 hypothetical protein [Sansalvadorimonas sp. 2012CJ34-2]